MSCNLFTSDGGLELVPEICLRIAECAEYHPETIRTLKRLSRSFQDLLSRNERSIARTIAAEQLILKFDLSRNIPKSSCPQCSACAAKAKIIRKDTQEQRAQSFKRQLQPSTILITEKTIQINTYTWLSELHFREKAIQELLENDIMSLTPSSNFASQFGFFNIALKAIEGRLGVLKRNALDLMFALADTASPFNDSASIRSAQEKAIANFTPYQLALLDMMAVMFSGGYALHEKKVRVEPEDTILIQEEQFVFEDRVLKYGPFFAWSYVFGNQEWFRKKMDEGMKEMRDFEEGIGSAKAGLSSCVTREFCAKVGCSFGDRWIKLNAAVNEMLNLNA